MFASDPPALGDPQGDLPGSTVSRIGPSDPWLASIGGTPMVALPRLAGENGGRFELRAKAEFRNPTGSVKDRTAWGIVSDALANGRLGGGEVLVDASSGNTGVAYAMLGARLGFPVRVYVPATAHPDRIDRMRALGAETILTDPAEGTDGAQREAEQWAARHPGRSFYGDQYRNPANPLAHYRSTGPEIWTQTGGRLSHFVAGVGTGGTLSGVARYLKERNPAIRVIAVEPDRPLHGLEGLKHLPSVRRPETYDARLVDRTIRVSTEEAEALRQHLGPLEGLWVGRSAAAALVASVRVGGATPGAFVVTVLPDAPPEDRPYSAGSS